MFCICIPELKANVFSVGMITDKGYDVLFSANGAVFDERVKSRQAREGTVFCKDFKPLPPQKKTLSLMLRTAGTP